MTLVEFAAAARALGVHRVYLVRASGEKIVHADALTAGGRRVSIGEVPDVEGLYDRLVVALAVGEA